MGRRSSSAMKTGSNSNDVPLSISGWPNLAPPVPGQIGLSQTRQVCLGCAIAMTGPCRTGNGGVFLSLCNIVSNARQTFFPSNFTSIENMTNSALPLILLDTTPPPALPASSPVLMLKFESLTHAELPSHFTLVVPE